MKPLAIVGLLMGASLGAVPAQAQGITLFGGVSVGHAPVYGTPSCYHSCGHPGHHGVVYVAPPVRPVIYQPIYTAPVYYFIPAPVHVHAAPVVRHRVHRHRPARHIVRVRS